MCLKDPECHCEGVVEDGTTLEVFVSDIVEGDIVDGFRGSYPCPDWCRLHL